MSSAAGHRHPECHALNHYLEKGNRTGLTVLVNNVRFHIAADPSQWKAKSGPGGKIMQEYKDLVAAAMAAENDFTKPCSRENLRTRKPSRDSDTQDSGHGAGEDNDDHTDRDSAIDVQEQKKERLAFMEEATEEPIEALKKWMLTPFGPIFDQQAPKSDKQAEQSVRDWYDGMTFFYNLDIDESGKLTATEEDATESLERKISTFLPKMFVPKHIRDLNLPWYPAKDVVVLEESDEIEPYHPSRVRIGEKTYFLKMVDPTQPQPTRREIDLLHKAEKLGLHKHFRVPLVKGLVGFEDSKTEMMGFLQTEIEDPTPLTKLLDEEVPQEKRDLWAEESQRIIDVLHDHNIVWGDAKADNFMVDKHDNLWIIDFGGSYTDGWIDPELMETEEGDDMGVERIANALHDPEANTWDPTQGEELPHSVDSSSAGRKRKVGKLNENSVHHNDQEGNEISESESKPRKRAKKEVADPNKSETVEKPEGDPEEEEEEIDDEDADQGDDADQDEDIADHCICDGSGSGEMIGCDNSNCQRQWFHFECVGLDKAPAKSKSWYCDDCKA